MSTIYLDVENESNKINIKTEIFLIFLLRFEFANYST
jgi:hypothetical protein